MHEWYCMKTGIYSIYSILLCSITDVCPIIANMSRLVVHVSFYQMKMASFTLYTYCLLCTLYIIKCSCGTFSFTRLRNGRQLQNKDIHYTCTYLTTVFHLTLWCMISMLSSSVKNYVLYSHWVKPNTMKFVYATSPQSLQICIRE
jgi:hypothetical protein